MSRMAAGAAALLSLAACAAAPSFPPIATGVSGDAAFKARIAERYRPGSPARRLEADLAADGFAVEAADRGRHLATKRTGDLPCISDVRVQWSERRGRIVEIAAERHDCT